MHQNKQEQKLEDRHTRRHVIHRHTMLHTTELFPDSSGHRSTFPSVASSMVVSCQVKKHETLVSGERNFDPLCVCLTLQVLNFVSKNGLPA